MSKRSIRLGLWTLLGLVIGLILKNIMVWTFVGMGVGYLMVFWLPVLRRHFHR